MKRLSLIIVCVSITSAVSVASAGTLADVPYYFTANTPAVAAEVNANFDAVVTEINDNAGEIATNTTAIADQDTRITAVEEAFQEAFQLSGNIAESVTVGGGQEVSVQRLILTIPAGKMLVLKRVRHYVAIYAYLRLRVTFSLSGSSEWKGTVGGGDLTPNTIIFDNSGGGTLNGFALEVSLKNDAGGSLSSIQGAGWWLDLALE